MAEVSLRNHCFCPKRFLKPDSVCDVSDAQEVATILKPLLQLIMKDSDLFSFELNHIGIIGQENKQELPFK